jgi:hypothetical protein
VKQRTMVLMGPQDSGTNLMMNSLFDVWPERVLQACQWSSLPSQAHCNIYKHSNDGVNGVYQALQKSIGNDLSDTVLVAMTRSPIAQIASWRKAPYCLKDCVNRDWQQYKNNCSAPLSAYGCTETDCPPRGHVEFRTTMDVYNSFMRQYKQLRNDGRFAAVHLVAYEDLVYSPEEVMAGLQKDLHWPEKPVYLEDGPITDPAKHSGRAQGRETAIENLKSRTHLKLLGAKAVRILCGLLDDEAVAGLTEGTYEEKVRYPYIYDCEP